MPTAAPSQQALADWRMSDAMGTGSIESERTSAQRRYTVRFRRFGQRVSRAYYASSSSQVVEAVLGSLPEAAGGFSVRLGA